MVERRLIEVEGIVQGVGFRPFVYRLAYEYGLSGSVRNSPAGVAVEVEGPSRVVDSFVSELRKKAPPLAVITGITTTGLPLQDDLDFTIDVSADSGHRAALIAPDVSVCADCHRELFDPADRRYLYPFINCTNCGPRYTIIEDIPYDRVKTTMSKFDMCPDCKREYGDPIDRRFHAQPDACWKCGPQMTLTDCDGKEVETSDPIAAGAEYLADGKIVAVKSLGGFQFAVDATLQDAVLELRRRKRREEKPLAVMAPDIETVRTFCYVSTDERSELESPMRPIVLLRARDNTSIAPAVAPMRHEIGVMLPYTPLHYLLFRSHAFTALVMTSGNFSEEPIETDNETAVDRLGSVADYFLMHDRPVHLRSDDSVLRVNRYGGGMIRRARGYAPRPVLVEIDMPSILACGAELKNTVCLTSGRRAFVSQHVGDIQNMETYAYHIDTVTHMRRILDIEPEIIAHDLHPDYLCTPAGGGIPIPEDERPSNVRLVGVQHHHAHIAAAMAEHGIDGPVIGIALDGTGYGTDGKVWGGEILLAKYTEFCRKGHFDYVPIPGGDAAARQAWRSAAGYLARTFGVEDGRTVAHGLLAGIPHDHITAVFDMVDRGINSPSSSGCGRLFDAMAALTGTATRSSYEGQAPCEFEAVMTRDQYPAYPFTLSDSDGDAFTISFSPMVAEVVEDVRSGTHVSIISRRVHETVMAACIESARRVRSGTDIDLVVLSGGVFQNAFLAEMVPERLTADSFDVYTHRSLPPNDGCISVGQAVITAHRVVDESD